MGISIQTQTHIFASKTINMSYSYNPINLYIYRDERERLASSLVLLFTECVLIYVVRMNSKTTVHACRITCITL